MQMLWTFMRVGKQGLIMRAALQLYRGATGSCCRPAVSWGPAGPGAHSGVLVALGCPWVPPETPTGAGGERVSTMPWGRGLGGCSRVCTGGCLVVVVLATAAARPGRAADLCRGAAGCWEPPWPSAEPEDAADGLRAEQEWAPD